MLSEEVSGKDIESLRLAIETRKTQRMDYGLPTSTGTRHFEARTVAVSNDEVVSFIQNITDRKHTEIDLREREQELAIIYDKAPLMIPILNTDRRITKVNAFAKAITGLTPEGLLGKRVGEILGCAHARKDGADASRRAA